jgi:phage gp36-like protein
MGTYIVQADLKAVLSDDDLLQLTDDAGVGEVDATVLAGVIARSEGEFHGYAAKRYATPVDVTGDATLAATIRGRLLDLVAYYLRGRRPGMPQEVRDRYTDAQRWLRDLADGKVTLGVAPNQSAGNTILSGGETRQMTHDKMKGL